MKALVLAGGSGTRLRPLSYSLPKQLIPLANKPVLEYVLDNIRALGVTDIGVVVAAGGGSEAEITATLGSGARFGATFTYIPQDAPRGLAHTVAIARDFLGDDDFVMHLGDSVLPDGVASIAGEFTGRRPAAQIAVHKVSDPRAFGVAQLGPGGEVIRVVEKPRQWVSDLALVGVYFFTPAVHEAVAAIAPSARGELEITDAVQWLVGRGADVRAGDCAGYWKDIGRAADVLECNRFLLRRLRPLVAGDVDGASVLTGPVTVERGARVVRSRIDGPALVGAGALVEEGRVGPGTCIGRGCVVRGAELEETIIMEGASIAGIRGLTGSLIGRHARLGAAAGAGCHRMVVGDHTRVDLAA